MREKERYGLLGGLHVGVWERGGLEGLVVGVGVGSVIHFLWVLESRGRENGGCYG